MFTDTKDILREVISRVPVEGSEYFTRWLDAEEDQHGDLITPGPWTFSLWREGEVIVWEWQHVIHILLPDNRVLCSEVDSEEMNRIMDWEE